MLRLAIIALFSGLLSTAVLAEQAQEKNILQVPILIPCDDKQEMVKVIKKYGENRFVEADGIITVVTGQGTTITGTVTIWVNPQTWSYSITIEDNNRSSGLMCMIASGANFQPAGQPI